MSVLKLPYVLCWLAQLHGRAVQSLVLQAEEQLPLFDIF